jgi:hypothetical protein
MIVSYREYEGFTAIRTISRVLETRRPILLVVHRMSIDWKCYHSSPRPRKFDIKLAFDFAWVIGEYDVALVEHPYQLRLREVVMFCFDQITSRVSMLRKELIEANGVTMPAVCASSHTADAALLDAADHRTSHYRRPGFQWRAEFDIPEL